MRRAGVCRPETHVRHLRDLDASTRAPVGRVSRRIYDDLMSRREFDQYARQVSTTSTSTTTERSSLSTPPGRPPPPSLLEEDRKRVAYKPERFGPPGLAPPRTGVAESEGNDRFHAYDGAWRDGMMEGGGIYRFSDGTYEGHFKEGVPDGEGAASYPGGGRYVGTWQRGRYQGSGTMRYASGSVYAGSWKEGRRHGRGVLTTSGGLRYRGEFQNGRFHGRGELFSESTGFRFTGTFHRGFINGPGTLETPEGKTETRIWSKYGGFTLKQLADTLRDEEAAEEARIRKERRDLFGVRAHIRLLDEVEKVRHRIATLRAEEKAEAERAERAKIREREAKMKEAREQAIEDLARASDARAGIVRLPSHSSSSSSSDE
ncbi:hypothetical protein CTAYLR_010749 [Chrysophaeum taylorii]|uniref:Uncharacterized protein n=1 Tax=Chrysophaeum taylorii TaxID=2483200 RepID=A0AAD7U6T5_9STRA|nr:hypothetical protein CTAYLR_010749 [Chrysophaeum taylorii]